MKFDVPTDYTPYAQGGWKEEYKEWCDVEKFADKVYIFNTASDPGSLTKFRVMVVWPIVDRRVSIGQVHTTRFLLHHKKTPINNCAWHYGTTILGCAIESGDLEMVKHLIHYGADVNQPHTREGWTPLFTAIKKRKFNIAKYLVEEHKCIVAEHELEETMMFVTGSDEVNMFKFLVEKGNLLSLMTSYVEFYVQPELERN